MDNNITSEAMNRLFAESILNDFREGHYSQLVVDPSQEKAEIELFPTSTRIDSLHFLSERKTHKNEKQRTYLVDGEIEFTVVLNNVPKYVIESARKMLLVKAIEPTIFLMVVDKSQQRSIFSFVNQNSKYFHWGAHYDASGVVVEDAEVPTMNVSIRVKDFPIFMTTKYQGGQDNE